MTHINQTCPDDTRVKARRRRAAMNRSRRQNVQLVYDGVTAAYIRDISRRPQTHDPGVRSLA